MGNKASVPTIRKSGITSLVQPNVKEALKSTRLSCLSWTAQKSEALIQNKYGLEVDQNTFLFVRFARACAAAKVGKVVNTKEMCKTFVDKRKVKLFNAENLPMLPFLQEDEDIYASDLEQKAFKLLVKDLSSLPMVEKYPIYFDSEEDADKSRFELFGSNGLPAHSVYWHHWESDSTIQNFAFNGLGAYYLSRVTKVADASVPATAVYEINLSHYKDFAVRRMKDTEEAPRSWLHQPCDMSHPSQMLAKKDSLPGPDNEELFFRYGGIFYFDEAKKPLGIYWSEKNTFVPLHTPEFQPAWHIFRSTIVTAATVQHHLLIVHWIVANAATVNCARFLSATHPIRRLLKPHTYGTACTNFNSTAVLAPIRGLAYRIFGFNQKGFLDTVTNALTSFKYETLEEHFQAAKLNPDDRKSIPFYEDGLEFWDIVEDYVRNYVALNYPEDADIMKDAELNEFWTSGYQLYFGKEFAGKLDFAVGDLSRANLIKLLTYHIFWVTGGHEFIGAIVEYLVDCRGLSPKVYRPRPDDKKFNHRYESDCQTFFQALSLISLTSGNMPKLIDSWEHLFDDDAFLPAGKKRTAIVNNLGTFQERLVHHREVVRKRNLKRVQPLNVFSGPLESSVSV